MDPEALWCPPALAGANTGLALCGAGSTVKLKVLRAVGAVGARTSLEPGSACGMSVLHLLGLLHTQRGLVVGTQYQGMVIPGTQSHMGQVGWMFCLQLI